MRLKRPPRGRFSRAVLPSAPCFSRLCKPSRRARASMRSSRPAPPRSGRAEIAMASVSTRRILSADKIIDRRADVAIFARSPYTLGSYPAKIPERLEHWAAAAPERVFLAARNDDGDWRRLSYGDALRRVRNVAQALLNRRLSNDRPVVILSGNSIEHAILALGAMYAGIMYVPVAPSYSLLARDFTTLRAMWDALRPGLVFAAEGQPFERAVRSVVARDAPEIVTCAPIASVPSTSFDELEATPATTAVDDAHACI